MFAEDSGREKRSLAEDSGKENVFAEDNPRPGLSRAEVLSGAPKQDDECYRVPAVLGE